MLQDQHPGVDGGERSWFAEPYYTFRNSDGAEVRGTFRSSKCSRLGIYEDNMCHMCSRVPKLKSFRLRAVNRKSERSRTIRNEYLTPDETLSRLQAKQEALRKANDKLFLIKVAHLRQKRRVANLNEKLAEYSKRGDVTAVTKQIAKAAGNGMLDDKVTLLQFLQDMAHNLNVKGKNGKRYSISMKMFYEVLLLWGGPRLANFMSINMGGPEIHSIYRWRKELSLSLNCGIHTQNSAQMVDFYRKAMVSGCRVPILLAEDETAIIPRIDYDEKNDQLLGFCGEVASQSSPHKCKDAVLINVGEGVEGYQTITNSFQKYKVGSQARAVIINPLHPTLPKVPILLMPTCNTFDASFISQQWDILQEHLTGLETVVGPIIGNSSDGDARRRSVMVDRLSSVDGNKFQPIPRSLGFVFTARKCPIVSNSDGHTSRESPEPTYVLRDLMDQDYVHNHKKLVNHMHHTSRVMTMGRYVVLSNHILRVYRKFPFEQHGLSIDDVERSDRQNWRSAQKVAFLSVQECLQKLVDGDEETPGNAGMLATLTFIKIIWFYVEIFISTTASLKTRIKYCALVGHFLAIWHNHVYNSSDLTTKQHFLSHQTYVDIIISIHCAVSLICYMRDSFPGVACHLHLTGTDVVEDYWSKNGQWVGNQHNYSFGRLQKNATHMLRLEQIRTHPEAPNFAKTGHCKSEIIWPQQYPGNWPLADLADYPSEMETLEAWKEGIEIARTLAIKVGITPVSEIRVHDNLHPDNDDADRTLADQWFFKPFSTCGNERFTGDDLTLDDDDDTDGSTDDHGPDQGQDRTEG